VAEAEREKQQLKEMMQQTNDEQKDKGHRQAHLKHTLLGALRSQAQRSKHSNQVDSLSAKIAHAEQKEQALQQRLATAESEHKEAVHQSHQNGHQDGHRQAHLKHSLLGHLRLKAKDNVHSGQMSKMEDKLERAAQHHQELQQELEQARVEQEEQKIAGTKGIRKLDLKHKLMGHLQKEALNAKHVAKHDALQQQIEQAEAKKQELVESLELERIKGEEAATAAQAKGMRKSDLKNKLLAHLRSQATAKKHEANIEAMQAQIESAVQQQAALKLEAEATLNSVRQEGAAAIRKANLKNKLLGHLKKEAMTTKFNSEKEKLEAEKKMAQQEKEQVDQVLAKTKEEAAVAAAEAELARKKERQMRLKMALKNHLKSEAQKDKEKMKADALKQAALAATKRANDTAQQLADAQELAELQLKESEKKLKRQRIKGSLFSHLKQEARANKAKASRMADVRKLMKKHGAGILEKVRTQKERAKDKQKLVAMKEALQAKAKAAEEEKLKIEAEQKQRILDLEKQHEEVKKQMEEQAKMDAERVKTETRTHEVKGLFKKHRGNLMAKAKAARAARMQQENLEQLMADIELEKKQSALKAKAAEDKLANELETQRTMLERQQEDERMQHAAELEQEQLKLAEEKKIAMNDLEVSLKQKAKEDQELAVEGAVKAAKKRTFKGLLGKHAKNLKRVAELDRQQAQLKATQEKLQQQEEEAAAVEAKKKKTRFSSMLKKQKGNIGRMATLTKERKRAQAKAQKAMDDLTQLKKDKEGSERRSKFTSMFSRAAAKSKSRDLKGETERLKKKWLDRPGLREMIVSHDKMAAAYRGFKLRQHFDGIRQTQMHLKEDRSNAAVQIQKIARKMLGAKRFSEAQKLAWYDRPKTDATTNTVGYTHSTQQTKPAGALMLSGGGLSRQLSVDSLDSARDIAERQGELSDDSIEEMDNDEEEQHNTANVDRRVGKSSQTRSRGAGGSSKHEKGVQARGTRRWRKEKQSLYGSSGGGRSGGTGTSPVSALYRYTAKSMPKEMTPYDAEFPSNRDELIQSAIETLMN